MKVDIYVRNFLFSTNVNGSSTFSGKRYEVTECTREQLKSEAAWNEYLTVKNYYPEDKYTRYCIHDPDGKLNF